MTDAPERIFAAPPHDDPEWSSGAGEWDVSENWAVPQMVKYIRADKVAALVEEAIREGMRIATFVPIEQVQEAFDAALAALDAKP